MQPSAAFTDSSSLQEALQEAAAAAGAAAAAAALDDGPAPAPGVQRIAYPVWWHAPFYSGTGYGTEAISYVVALLQTNRFRREDIWISHSGDMIKQHVADSLDKETLQLLQEQEYNSLIRGRLPQAELQRPAIAVCHTFPDCYLMAKDTNSMDVPGCPCPSPEMKDLVVYKVGRTMFETASLPKHLVAHCNSMDEVWVPTEFNRETFAAAGVSPEKLFVLPQGIDAAYFDPARHEPLVLRQLPGTQLVTGSAGDSYARSSSSSSSSQGTRPYVFMSVFKWETRKGWDVLLDAYLHGFTAQEPVELHIMTKPFGKGKENFRDQVLQWLQRRFSVDAVQAALMPRVYVYGQHVDDATYPRLYASCDCVVLPTRGEGWGRPQMEAMAMAKPVITTNWSGPTAYINDDVAYPLAVSHLAAADADMNFTVADAKEINLYFKGQLWAQPDVNHLRQLMRQVFSNPQQAAAKGAAARQHILAYFTPEGLASKVMSEIMRIQNKLGLNRTVPPPEERQEAAATKALCLAYPELCKKGSAGLAEAEGKARSSFSNYRSHHASNSNSAVQRSKMTVAEILAQNKQLAVLAEQIAGQQQQQQHQRHQRQQR
uniref:Glycosyl transferase family 1 domain-containing protein n=1 Tax=Tetradesmus obliquus TaxID=3088 RepID=A0A383VNX1_TETOB|eukprot:jgi/Sobl393_1/13670/SZX67225.1